jgi:sulfate-transporting ATPase
LDAAQRIELGGLLGTVAKEWGLGVLLVEHDVSLVFRVCDRVVALVAGRVVAEGTPDQVRNNEILLEAYLGQRSAEASGVPASVAEQVARQRRPTGGGTED